MYLYASLRALRARFFVGVAATAVGLATITEENIIGSVLWMW